MFSAATKNVKTSSIMVTYKNRKNGEKKPSKKRNHAQFERDQPNHEQLKNAQTNSQSQNQNRNGRSPNPKKKMKHNNQQEEPSNHE